MRWLGLGRERSGVSAPLSGETEAPPKGAVVGDDVSDGAVWVESGVIRVRNPLGVGRWPVLEVAGEGDAIVRLNGEVVQGQAVVRAEDEMTVEGIGEALLPGSVEVQVSADAMAADVTVHPQVRRVISLQEAEPTLRLTLRFAEQLVPIGQATDLGAVREALRKAGVVAEPDARAVAHALATPGTAVTVAWGRPPRVGRTARLWTAVLPDAEHDLDALVDGKAVVAGDGVYIEMGQPVVVVTPGVAPEDGETVTGHPMGAVQTGGFVWSAGPGVLLSADDRTAIAARSGRPEVVISHDHIHVAVYATDRVEGDVTAGTGPLTFDGDVRFEGTLQQGAVICARGNIEVAGDVTGAHLLAGGSVVVHGGAVGSKLVAGGSAMRYAAAAPLCRQLAFALLQSDRANSAPDRVQALCAKLPKALDGGQGSCLTDEVDALHRLLPVLATTAGALRPDQAAAAAGLLGDAAQIMERGALRAGPCSVHHLQRSRVEASGEVTVGSAGVYMSEIVTMDRALVEGPVRGGRIRAERGARVEEAGSEAEVTTRFEIGEGAVFEAGTVYPGTVVTSGGRAYKFSVETKAIRLTGPDLTGPARPGVPGAGAA